MELTPEVEAAKLKEGDFLISRSNTFELVGFAGIFNEKREDISFPDTMMLITLDENRVDKRFLKEFLLSTRGRRQMQRIAAGTSASMKKINRTGLSSLFIPLPPLHAQRWIMEQLDICTQALRAAEYKRDNSRTLKNALIKKLLVSSLQHIHCHV